MSTAEMAGITCLPQRVGSNHTTLFPLTTNRQRGHRPRPHGNHGAIQKHPRTIRVQSRQPSSDQRQHYQLVYVFSLLQPLQ